MDVLIENIRIEKLISVVTETAQHLITKNNNQFEISNMAQGYQIFTDVLKVRQIILNLLSNAAKFTHNGTITLTIQPFDKWIRFDVSDTGIGIKPEAISTIFNEFIQADVNISRDYGGTGLGLAITRGLCTLLGGTVHVESKPNIGSTFYVKIPSNIGLKISAF